MWKAKGVQIRTKEWEGSRIYILARLREIPQAILNKLKHSFTLTLSSMAGGAHGKGVCSFSQEIIWTFTAPGFNPRLPGAKINFLAKGLGAMMWFFIFYRMRSVCLWMWPFLIFWNAFVSQTRWSQANSKPWHNLFFPSLRLAVQQGRLGLDDDHRHGGQAKHHWLPK